MTLSNYCTEDVLYQSCLFLFVIIALQGHSTDTSNVEALILKGLPPQ